MLSKYANQRRGLRNRWHDRAPAAWEQLSLFPEPGNWRPLLRLLPWLGSTVGLALLLAIAMPSEVGDRRSALMDDSRLDDDTPVPDPEAIRDHIRAAAARHRLSEELITAVIFAESEFDPNAVSRKGARGLMQLMPQTARIIGVRDPHDPLENIDAGASHLRAMMDRFDNNLPLALAAYNAGDRVVIRHRGIPPYPETRGFVLRVLRRVKDRRTAERLVAMAEPVPPPRWTHVAPQRPKATAATLSTGVVVVRPAVFVGPAIRPDARLEAHRAPVGEPDIGHAHADEGPPPRTALGSPPEAGALAAQSP